MTKETKSGFGGLASYIQDFTEMQEDQQNGGHLVQLLGPAGPIICRRDLCTAATCQCAMWSRFGLCLKVGAKQHVVLAQVPTAFRHETRLEV